MKGPEGGWRLGLPDKTQDISSLRIQINREQAFRISISKHFMGYTYTKKQFAVLSGTQS